MQESTNCELVPIDEMVSHGRKINRDLFASLPDDAKQRFINTQPRTLPGPNRKDRRKAASLKRRKNIKTVR